MNNVIGLLFIIIAVLNCFIFVKKRNKIRMMIISITLTLFGFLILTRVI